jgi:uncharacterized RmlC-like cupin family protein
MSTCKIIRRGRGEGFHGKQGLDYFSGVSAEIDRVEGDLHAYPRHAAGC